MRVHYIVSAAESPPLPESGCPVSARESTLESSTLLSLTSRSPPVSTTIVSSGGAVLARRTGIDRSVLRVAASVGHRPRIDPTVFFERRRNSAR